MDSGIISVRYAKALLKGATDLKLENEVYVEMQMLAKSYLQVPQLRFTIDNPMLGKDRKLTLLQTACGGELTKITATFLQLVLNANRENIIQFMANAFITLYRRQKNIIRGTLTTAVAVSADTELKMKRMVEAKTHGMVEFNTEVDPSIIGGFILEYDTYRMDASVKTKLSKVLHLLSV